MAPHTIYVPFSGGLGVKSLDGLGCSGPPALCAMRACRRRAAPSRRVGGLARPGACPAGRAGALSTVGVSREDPEA